MTTTVTTPPRVRPSTRLTPVTMVDVAVLLILSAIGIIGFATSFEALGWLIAGLAGLAVGTVFALASHFLRLGAVPTFIFAVVGFYLFGSAAALPVLSLLGFIPTLDSLTQLSVGTVFGWSDILTLRPPVELPDYVTSVPYVSGWAVGLVSTVLAVRWLPVRRRTAWRSGLILIGPVALYLAGVLLGTDQPFYAALRGVTFAALALIWIGWRRGVLPGVTAKADRGMLRKKLVGTAVVVTAAVLIGAFAGSTLAPAPDNRFVLREEVEPPFEPLNYASPFSAFRKYTKTLEETDLFTVTGLQPGDRVRLATLDTYDGILWGVAGSAIATDGSGSFSLVGKTIPAPPLVTDAEDGRKLDVAILDYSDVWIPSIGYAESISFNDAAAREQAEDLRYNPATGTAVVTSGLESGDEYTLDASRQQEFQTDDLLTVPTASLQLPPVSNIPDIVSAKAVELAGDAASPIEQLRAIESTLQTTGFLSHGAADDAVASRAGQGADRMVELFTRSQLIGDEEQYASAFALMARSLNFPARVVMGFAPEVVDGQDSVTVRGADVTAWVEVAFEGVGWVPFYPTPDETDIPQDENPKPQSEPQPQVRQPPRTESDQNDLVAGVEIDDTGDDADAPFELPGWVIAVGLAVLIPLALLLLPLVIVGVIKSRRLRRRRAGRGDRSMAGAWEELVDRFSELGFAIPENLTRKGTASGLENQLASPTADLVALAERTDEAVFSGTEVPNEAADVAWTEALAAVVIARAAISRGKRFAARYRISSMRAWTQKLAARAVTESSRLPGLRK